MISQKDSKQVSMDSWLLKLLSRDMKTKKTKTNQQKIIKKNRTPPTTPFVKWGRSSYD